MRVFWCRLHQEINEFVEYIQPTAEELTMRQGVVDRVRAVVLELWPMAKV